MDTLNCLPRWAPHHRAPSVLLCRPEVNDTIFGFLVSTPQPRLRNETLMPLPSKESVLTVVQLDALIVFLSSRGRIFISH